MNELEILTQRHRVLFSAEDEDILAKHHAKESIEFAIEELAKVYVTAVDSGEMEVAQEIKKRINELKKLIE